MENLGEEFMDSYPTTVKITDDHTTKIIRIPVDASEAQGEAIIWKSLLHHLIDLHFLTKTVPLISEVNSFIPFIEVIQQANSMRICAEYTSYSHDPVLFIGVGTRPMTAVPVDFQGRVLTRNRGFITRGIKLTFPHWPGLICKNLEKNETMEIPFELLEVQIFV
uniref:Uncharacterized protein n=1 Tax=Panagrellus redivivus TaxID=6233 RepID=A0A7E4VQC3_PANRE